MKLLAIRGMHQNVSLRGNIIRRNPILMPHIWIHSFNVQKRGTHVASMSHVIMNVYIYIYIYIGRPCARQPPTLQRRLILGKDETPRMLSDDLWSSMLPLKTSMESNFGKSNFGGALDALLSQTLMDALQTLPVQYTEAWLHELKVSMNVDRYIYISISIYI